ncbi:MAG: hypothetical protein PHN44_00640 [Candidatus Marinimicrobia bacterium]|nr:hypothetical protein [Candidatus Neomarinimicrobiota bacterium]MDD5539127.1 hypothetical protein [Candidatus Neomarinimicrobiota bacterium]
MGEVMVPCKCMELTAHVISQLEDFEKILQLNNSKSKTSSNPALNEEITRGCNGFIAALKMMKRDCGLASPTRVGYSFDKAINLLEELKAGDATHFRDLKDNVWEVLFTTCEVKGGSTTARETDIYQP